MRKIVQTVVHGSRLSGLISFEFRNASTVLLKMIANKVLLIYFTFRSFTFALLLKLPIQKVRKIK